MGRKLTTDEFIEKAISIHGNKYSYECVDYKNNNTEVEIICPEHGSFYMKPTKHTNMAQECPKCTGVVHQHTQETFIEKCREHHGDFYDYSLVVYTKNYNNVKIICPRHGVFEQLANSHATGKGCSKCYHERKAINRAVSFESFVERSRDVHGSKYTYSKKDFVLGRINNKTKIHCPQHGWFNMSPTNHMFGRGCKKCSYAERYLDTDKFIKAARNVHKNKFDYKLSEYSGYNIKLKIICPEHGIFEQTPRSHLSGAGCSSCAKRGFNRSKEGVVYILCCDNIVKVGISNRSAKIRAKCVSESSGKYFEVIKEYLLDGNSCEKVEKSSLEKLKNTFKQPNEKFDGYTECFITDNTTGVIALVESEIDKVYT